MQVQYKNIQSSFANVFNVIKALTLASIVSLNLMQAPAYADTPLPTTPTTSLILDFDNTTPGRPKHYPSGLDKNIIREPKLNTPQDKPK
jgi:hypothetical protein